jgi:thioesterase domain-containing protein/NAD(P)-dependent dehydrogenase (short-subunit alcohol dehydrogenase family)
LATPEANQEHIGKLADMKDWFYKPVWKRSEFAAVKADEPLRWLVFLDALGLGKALVKGLEKAGHDVFTVQEERQYTKTGQRAYALNPRMREDYFDLLDDLSANDGLPHRIIHLWAVTGEKPPGYSRVEFYEKNRDNLFYSLLFLTQALAKSNLPHPIEIGVVSNDMQEVKGEGLRHPEKAILLGPCRVIPHEYANLSCRSVDVVMHKPDMLSQWLNTGGEQVKQLAQQLMAEFSVHSDQAVVAYRDGERWIQTYESSALVPVQNRLREGGVYLVTGGLGGIGLTVADYLAKAVKAKLILVGRSVLPARHEWDHWLKTQPAGNKVSQQIRKVLELEAMGAEVLVAAADVSNRKQLRVVINHALERFGTIHGVIHAAGTIDDNLIQLKTAGAVERVLAPKVRGALLLDELLQSLPLDFFILFSSTSTILGPVGQVDYAAANSFLDALAHSKQSQNTYTVTINWGMWQQVGMAVNASQQNKQRASKIAASKPGNHPLLEYCVTDTADTIDYVSFLNTDDYWIIDQHRLKDGTALLPGTGYLEIARAAIQNRRTDRALEISDLIFMRPLQVAEGEQREVHIGLHKNGNGYELAVTSRAGDDGDWLEHANGKVKLINDPLPTDRYPLEEIIARCRRDHITYAPGEQFTQQEQHLSFGLRWKVLREIYFGQEEALALLELPEDFVSDLESYALHPALLDLATGFALPLTQGYDASPDLYVPFSYGRVRVHAPLPARIYSHACYKGRQNDTTIFDVTLVDESGRVLVEINDFLMKRVNTPERIQTRMSRAADNVQSGKRTLLDVGLTDGIQPDEGIRVLEQVLSGSSAPQVVATSLSLDALAGLIATTVDVQPEGKKFSRPTLETEYVEPRDELEASLARIWQNALGIEQIGIHDDFFELGGQSLIAIRLLSQFRNEFGVDLPVVTFFEAPTIAQCAGHIRAETSTAQSGSKTERRKKRAKQLSSLVAIQPNGSKAPFFCVHGAGGNVMVYSVLSDYLGLEQPFYGLQEQGVDGKSEPLDRIEDMAALYIKEIREVYPHGPYMLGGFSMGGEVAFEMAQQLTAAGEEVGLLVLFDTLNPARSIRMHSFSTHTTATEDHNSRPGKITAISRKVMGHIRRLSKLTLREQIDYLSRDARMRLNRIRLTAGVRMAKASGKPLPYKLIEHQLWETNLKAVTNYVPRIYPHKLTLFRASENLDTNRVDDPMGWGPLAAGGVDEYIIEGTHRMLDEPYVVDVVRQLKISLDEAQRSYPNE